MSSSPNNEPFNADGSTTTGPPAMSDNESPLLQLLSADTDGIGSPDQPSTVLPLPTPADPDALIMDETRRASEHSLGNNARGMTRGSQSKGGAMNAPLLSERVVSLSLDGYRQEARRGRGGSNWPHTERPSVSREAGCPAQLNANSPPLSPSNGDPLVTLLNISPSHEKVAEEDDNVSGGMEPQAILGAPSDTQHVLVDPGAIFLAESLTTAGSNPYRVMSQSSDPVSSQQLHDSLGDAH